MTSSGYVTRRGYEAIDYFLQRQHGVSPLRSFELFCKWLKGTFVTHESKLMTAAKMAQTKAVNLAETKKTKKALEKEVKVMKKEKKGEGEVGAMKKKLEELQGLVKKKEEEAAQAKEVVQMQIKKSQTRARKTGEALETYADSLVREHYPGYSILRNVQLQANKRTLAEFDYVVAKKNAGETEVDDIVALIEVKKQVNDIGSCFYRQQTVLSDVVAGKYPDLHIEHHDLATAEEMVITSRSFSKWESKAVNGPLGAVELFLARYGFLTTPIATLASGISSAVHMKTRDLLYSLQYSSLLQRDWHEEEAKEKLQELYAMARKRTTMFESADVLRLYRAEQTLADNICLMLTQKESKRIDRDKKRLGKNQKRRFLLQERTRGFQILDVPLRLSGQAMVLSTDGVHQKGLVTSDLGHQYPDLFFDHEKLSVGERRALSNHERVQKSTALLESAAEKERNVLKKRDEHIREKMKKKAKITQVIMNSLSSKGPSSTAGIVEALEKKRASSCVEKTPSFAQAMDRTFSIKMLKLKTIMALTSPKIRTSLSAVSAKGGDEDQGICVREPDNVEQSSPRELSPEKHEELLSAEATIQVSSSSMREKSSNFSGTLPLLVGGNPSLKPNELIRLALEREGKSRAGISQQLPQKPLREESSSFSTEPQILIVNSDVADDKDLRLVKNESIAEILSSAKKESRRETVAKKGSKKEALAKDQSSNKNSERDCPRSDAIEMSRSQLQSIKDIMRPSESQMGSLPRVALMGPLSGSTTQEIGVDTAVISKPKESEFSMSALVTPVISKKKRKTTNADTMSNPAEAGRILSPLISKKKRKKATNADTMSNPTEAGWIPSPLISKKKRKKATNADTMSNPTEAGRILSLLISKKKRKKAANVTDAATASSLEELARISPPLDAPVRHKKGKMKAEIIAPKVFSIPVLVKAKGTGVVRILTSLTRDKQTWKDMDVQKQSQALVE